MNRYLGKALAAVLTAGIVVLATGGMAGAATATNPATATAPAAMTPARSGAACRRADARVARLRRVQHRTETAIDRTQKALARAQAHHNDKRVHRLETRLDRLQKAREKVVDRIAAIQQRCPGTE